MTYAHIRDIIQTLNVTTYVMENKVAQLIVAPSEFMTNAYLLISKETISKEIVSILSPEEFYSIIENKPISSMRYDHKRCPPT